jgi:hypothetical protein
MKALIEAASDALEPRWLWCHDMNVVYDTICTSSLLIDFSTILSPCLKIIQDKENQKRSIFIPRKKQKHL